MATLPFAAAVLTGGASLRMGRDKASLPIGGVAMAERVAAALREAGAEPIATVGLAVAGLPHVVDDHPGAGPLGGVLTALRWSVEQLVLVAPCDLLAPEPAAFDDLVGALRHADALAAVPGPAQPLPAAFRVAARPRLLAAFEAGERGLWRAVALLDPVTVALPAASTADADTPDELPPGAG